MTTRKGLGKGKGSGYYNLPPTYAHDKHTHHLAGKGIKSVQRMPQLVKSKFTGVEGKVVSREPFAVKYEINGKKFVRFSNPKYWVKGGKGMVMVKFDKNSYTMIPQKHVKDFQAQYGGSVCKGGKEFLTLSQLENERKNKFLSDSWKNIQKASANVGSGLKRAFEYEKEHLPEQLKALDPKTVAQGVAKSAQATAQYVADTKQAIKDTKKAVKSYFGDIGESGEETKEAVESIFTGKKAKHKRDTEQEAKIAEAKIIRPEIKKMDRQVKRVSEIKRQIAEDEDGEVDSSLIKELEEEEGQLRDLQEKATDLVVEDMSNAELRLLAIRHKEGDGFFSTLFGSENEYEAELLRRVRKENKIDSEVFQAKHEKPVTAKNIIKEIFF
jgi:hypothetical protein